MDVEVNSIGKQRWLILLMPLLILCGCQRETKEGDHKPEVAKAQTPVTSVVLPPQEVKLARPPNAVMRNDSLHVTSRYGPYLVGILRVDSVFVDIVTRLFPDPGCNFHRSDVSVIVFDKDQVLLCKNYPASCEDEITFAVYPVEIPNLGHLLLLSEEAVPSAPGSGVDGIYYSINKDGFFVPVTGLISPSSNSGDQSTFPIVKKTIAAREMLFVECAHWTGNFGVTYDYPVNLEGAWGDRAGAFGFETYPVRIDGRWAKEYRDSRASFGDTVTLFETPPFKSSSSRRVVVNHDAKIEFLDAVPNSYNWWLHIRIDGQEGYIGGSKDFDSVGLPDAG
jgi:hypothetical protein